MALFWVISHGMTHMEYAHINIVLFLYFYFRLHIIFENKTTSRDEFT